MIKITVGIKALNEEAHIGEALASAVAAVTPFGGEVVLADSGSTDRTVEIARTYPVRIVQLANRNERCCGAGAQLAFQHANGEYFYLLDGDMVLNPAFIEAGIAYLEANPGFAAVGGLVCERNTEGEGFQIRAASVAKDRHWLPGIVDRLDCGGLYRASAVREAGYFADRNLHAFEEFDLAARLQAHGWKLARIDVPQIDHFGHTTPGYQLLWRRLRSGYSGGPGEVLRGALGQPHLKLVLRKLGHVRNGIAVIAWWAMLLASLLLGQPLIFLALIAIPLALLSWRRGSFQLGLYSLAAWNVTAWGLLTGFFRGRVTPRKPLDSIDLSPGRTAS